MKTRLAAAVAVALLALTACGSSGGGGKALDAATALREARTHLDAAAGVHLSITSKDLPSAGEVLISADGVLTRAPAFQGHVTARVPTLGANEFPVTAVGGKVYVQLPLLGWQAINPSTYGIPDPATLLNANTGVSSLLTKTTGVTAGASVRGGERNDEVLTTYTGTLAGADVAQLLPGAQGNFQVTYTIDSGGVLHGAAITGIFVKPATSTYTITLDQYGTAPTITAP